MRTKWNRETVRFGAGSFGIVAVTLILLATQIAVDAGPLVVA